MLRNRSHVGQEYFHVLAGLGNVSFGISAQGFEFFRPVMFRNRFNRNVAAAGFFGSSLGNLSDGSACGERIRFRVDQGVSAGSLNRSQFGFRFFCVHISQIFIYVSRQNLFDFFGIFRTGIQRFFRHVRIHVYADRAVFAQFQSLEAGSQDIGDAFLDAAVFQCGNHAAGCFYFSTAQEPPA